MEDPLINLEIKVGHQEALIRDLREALDEHWQLIDGLCKEMTEMQAKLSTFQPSQLIDTKDEPPPPHY